MHSCHGFSSRRGALSKSIDTSRVIPYLYDLKPSDLVGPLAQFQAIQANEEDTRDLMERINAAIANSSGVSLDPEALAQAFTVWWPKLEQRLHEIPDSPSPAKPERSERDILEEILAIVRKEARDREEHSVHVTDSRLTSATELRYSELQEFRRSLRNRLMSTNDPEEQRQLEREMALVDKEIKQLRNWWRSLQNLSD